MLEQNNVATTVSVPDSDFFKTSLNDETLRDLNDRFDCNRQSANFGADVYLEVIDFVNDKLRNS